MPRSGVPRRNGGRLVGPEVKHAHSGQTRAERREDRLEHRQVLPLGRPVRSIHERELCAQQPDALRASAQASLHLGGARNIHQHRDRVPVTGTRRLLAFGVITGQRTLARLSSARPQLA